MDRDRLERAWSAMKALPFPEYRAGTELNAWLMDHLLSWDSAVAGTVQSILSHGNATLALDPEVFLGLLRELEAWKVDVDDPEYFSLNLAKCHVHLYRTIALELSRGEAGT
ncbi:hypothetical protein [Nocardiopsis aegyptia]|uniref:Uncharacterized protein n=1 Tax=Nocardiopsis aegyptia TaxID=220378 RepID=A0A7Z0EJ49_9ACTN|nr:hypothetical protein [Nocardiopsis aegyptia]NYJ32541.1 hypothetical protein [Nocardiopsis aegyptia]